jgi:hypothetical protein
VVLLSKPRVLPLNNQELLGTSAFDCDMSLRNCYHWDELHDWNTFNISITVEGFLTFPPYFLPIPGTYETALYLLPQSCAQVYIESNLVHKQCGNSKFKGGADASHIDWNYVKELGIETDRYDYITGDVPFSSISNSIVNKSTWVSIQLEDTFNGSLVS